MGEYVVDDAFERLAGYEYEAALIHLDDAWDRPGRCDGYGNRARGVTFETHELDETKRLVDLCYDALEEGGWLVMDVDDWLLPRIVDYIRETWGDVTAPPAYHGGGYRKTGRVVYTKDDGSVDRGGTGAYLRQSGYPVVFAHKGETSRRCYESAAQLCDRQREQYGLGTVKPLDPYVSWVDGLTEAGETIVEPCAGTAPACIAAEKLYGGDAEYIAIDIEEEAREAFYERRESEL